jgi:hypothetical protein
MYQGPGGGTTGQVPAAAAQLAVAAAASLRPLLSAIVTCFATSNAPDEFYINVGHDECGRRVRCQA